MKRLNPKTNKPFKHGDVREDGKVFWGYRKSHIDKNGFYKETWVNFNVFNAAKNRSVIYDKTRHASPMRRAKQLIKDAKRRSKSVSITQNWVLSKILLGKCELTGLPFDLYSTGTKQTNPYSPSLDRIDNSNREYSTTNTRVVLSCVNLALNQFGLETMKPIFKILSELK